MKTCTKCGKTVKEDSRFCDGCGAPMEQKLYCTKCGNEIDEHSAFCQNCGEQTVRKDFVDVYSDKPKKKKSFKKFFLIFLAIGVIAAISVAAFMLFDNKTIIKTNPYALYLKDNELLFSELKEEIIPLQLSDEYASSPEGLTRDVDDLKIMHYYYSKMKKSHDGKILFYAEGIENEECYSIRSFFNLYYRDITDEESETVKIDSDVREYHINDSTTIVTYVKGDERELFQYSMTEKQKEKIDKEVTNFYISSDGEKMYYKTSDGDIYIKERDKEKEKIASEASQMSICSNDFDTIFYVKEEALYRKTEDGEAEKISSGININVIAAYDANSIYYYIEEENPLKVYIEDDMKENDAKIQRPIEPERPDWSDYDDYDDYIDAYNKWCDDYDKYEIKYEEYEQKCERDDFREEMEEISEYKEKNLYYYNGTEEVLLSEYFCPYYLNEASSEPVLIYKTYNRDGKIKLSEAMKAEYFEELLYEYLHPDTQFNIAVKDTVYEIDKGNVESMLINEDGSTVYFIAQEDLDDSMHGDLYRVNITDGQASQPELYDYDVYGDDGIFGFISNEKFMYFKDCNVEERDADLYINKEKIAYDVSIYDIRLYETTDNLYYIKDMNDERTSGTLEVYSDGETTKIADDVFDFTVNADESVLYLYDYSDKYYNGELRHWKDGESSKVDDDVMYIFSVIEEEYYYNDSYKGITVW